MRFILKDRDGEEYFVRNVLDRYENHCALTSEDICEAQVFSVEVEGRELKWSPDIPTGTWKLIPVTMTIVGARI